MWRGERGNVTNDGRLRIVVPVRGAGERAREIRGGDPDRVRDGRRGGVVPGAWPHRRGLEEFMRQFFARAALVISLGAVALTGGCTRLRGHQGYVLDADLANSVQPGVDNRQSVAKVLGFDPED